MHLPHHRAQIPLQQNRYPSHKSMGKTAICHAREERILWALSIIYRDQSRVLQEQAIALLEMLGCCWLRMCLWLDDILFYFRYCLGLNSSHARDVKNGSRQKGCDDAYIMTFCFGMEKGHMSELSRCRGRGVFSLQSCRFSSSSY